MHTKIHEDLYEDQSILASDIPWNQWFIEVDRPEQVRDFRWEEDEQSRNGLFIFDTQFAQFNVVSAEFLGSVSTSTESRRSEGADLVQP